MGNVLKTKTIIALMLPLVLLLPAALRMQGQTAVSMEFNHTQVGLPYFKSYFTDFKDFAGRPAKWNGSQWIAASSITGAGIGLYLYDAQIRDFVIRNNPESFTQPDKWFLNPLGMGIWVAPVLGGMYFTGDKRAKGTALAVVKAYGYGVFTAGSLKYVLQRARPGDLCPSDPYHWDGPFGKWKYNAFPSRHAMLSFAMATVLAAEYKETIWVPVLCYSLATMASLARVQNGEHWPSDVLIGAALGFGIGKFVHYSSKQKPAEKLHKFD